MLIPSFGKRWLFSSGVDGIEQVREGDWQLLEESRTSRSVCAWLPKKPHRSSNKYIFKYFV